MKEETMPTEPLEEQLILDASEVLWEELENGWRRQVLFSGQLTLVVLEARGPTSRPSPLHRHINDQITYVLDGEIDVQVAEETRRIGKGGFFRVPANAPHGIRILTSSARLVDVFTPPREDFRQ
jgi:quercetin dioxygenase-like cupin family protein